MILRKNSGEVMYRQTREETAKKMLKFKYNYADEGDENRPKEGLITCKES